MTIEERPAKQKRSGKNILNVVINVVLVIAIVVAALCTYVSFVSASGNGVPNIFGMEVFSVQTDSMYPTLKSGDLVIDKAVKDTSKLEVNDIITYWTVINGERVLNTHRIYEIYDGGGYLFFETKGDNNNASDSLTVHESEVVGVYSSHISGVGKALDYLQTSTGFLIVIVIPVVLFFVYQLIQFFRVLFEYQSVKNRLKFQEEQDAKDAAGGKPAEAVPAAANSAASADVDRAALEAELRESLKAEMMKEMREEMRQQLRGQSTADETADETSPENSPKA